MKLSEQQRAYLQELTDGPVMRPTGDIPEWFEFLWNEDLIDVVGPAVFITEAGRGAIDSVED